MVKEKSAHESSNFLKVRSDLSWKSTWEGWLKKKKKQQEKKNRVQSVVKISSCIHNVCQETKLVCCHAKEIKNLESENSQ